MGAADLSPRWAGRGEAGGWCDLHCHLLYGLDDGARTWDDTLEMAKLLVDLGFSTVAASPHNRPEFASKAEALARLEEVRERLSAEQVPLELEPNSENYLFDDRFLDDLGTERARPIGQSRYVLVEAPYQAPVPMLPDLVFRMQLKGVKPVFAHPERCVEFERPGRAFDVVRAGAALQLDVGALIGRYGRNARKLAMEFLDQGLYAVAATDLHSPKGAREWLTRALAELRAHLKEEDWLSLLRDNPRKILRGAPLV